MFVAFFESVKYVGHLLPISFLRIFFGYYYFQQALQKFNGDYLYKPRLASMIAEAIPHLSISSNYKQFAEWAFISHWQTSAFIIVGLEFAFAFSYIVGYVVRPVAILATLYSLNLFYLLGTQNDEFFRIFVAINIVFAWLGAGRCLGLDYYFYKRKRGLWW